MGSASANKKFFLKNEQIGMNMQQIPPICDKHYRWDLFFVALWKSILSQNTARPFLAWQRQGVKRSSLKFYPHFCEFGLVFYRCVLAKPF